MITLLQHISNIKRLTEQIIAEDGPLYFAAQSSLSEFADRVFIDGKKTTGGSYQYNDTNPLYVNPSKTFGNTAPLKPPKGKTGKSVFAKTGKPHKTTYVESYKKLRELVVRESGFVNFVASGDLQSEVVNKSLRRGDNEVSIVVSSDANSGKLEGLIDKYDKVFELSDKEKNTFQRVFRLEVIKRIREGVK